MFQLLHQVFDLILVGPTTNILLFFHYIFNLVGLPGAFGFSIIALVAFIRLIFHPLTRQQMELTKKMEEMKPHLDRLTEKHKSDKQRLQQEQLKLYQQMGVNPASGCLYALVQIPVFIALYNVLILFLKNGTGDKVVLAVNKLVYVDFLKIATLDPWFFGFNLAATPSQFGKYGAYYLLIPVITAALQYFQVKVTMPQPKKAIVKKDDKKKDKSPDMQTMMGRQMLFIFPIMIGYISYNLPIGLALYWNIFSLFSIIQYRKPKKKMETSSSS